MSRPRKKKVFTNLQVVEDQRAANQVIVSPDVIAIVQRGRPRWIKFQCPCGCGDVISINLDPRVGEYWRLYLKGKKVGIAPSVWRDSGCGSHFILWANVAHMFGETRRRKARPLLSDSDVLKFLREHDIDSDDAM